jgi:hypothetical protein
LGVRGLPRLPRDSLPSGARKPSSVPRDSLASGPRRLRAVLFTAALLGASCGPPPLPRTGPPPAPFHDRSRGVRFEPPAPPYYRSETDAANSIAHYADHETRAGIHLLAYASFGPTDARALAERATGYVRGLADSVPGMVMLGQRPIERFGLAGFEIEYDGGTVPRMRTIDWILYAPGLVYIVKVTAPAERFAELARPLLASRASLTIEPPGVSADPPAAGATDGQRTK